MADATPVTPAPRKRRGWLRALAWIVGILIVLVVVVYLVATSSAFFKGVILPRVGSAMNAQVTVSDASISPFSQVVLHNLKVQTTGTEPLVSAAEVRLRYSLMDIMRGNMHVDEVTLASPTVTLVENADGTCNLDPILKSQQGKAAEKKPEQAPKPSGGKPLQVDFRKFALTDGTVRSVKNYANGKKDVAEISHVNVTLTDLKNGQTGKLTLGADIAVQNTNGTLQAKAGGDFTFSLSADLKPTSVKGSTRLDVSKAEGGMAELAGFGSELNVDLSPTDIKEVALRFQKGDARLGQLRVSGPFNMEKLEGRLSIVLEGIDKKLLNLAGASSGIDFGGTTISSTNEVELAKGGSVITAVGEFDVTQLQLTRTNQTTPRLDLRKAYDVTIDRGQSVATLRRLTLTGTQNGNPMLKGELTSPMQIAWGNTTNAVGDSALTLSLSNLDLADWKAFAGDAAPSGLVNATVKVLSQQGGKLVNLDLDSRIDRLVVKVGTNQLAGLAITFHTSAKATNLKQFNLADYKLEVARDSQMLASLSGSGTYDQDAQTADIKLAAHAALAQLLRALPQPEMNISSGTADLDVRITQKQENKGVTGNFTLAAFTGVFGTSDVHDLGMRAEFDVGMTPLEVAIRKVTGKLTQAGKAGGSFDLSGTYNVPKANLNLNARLADINQNGIGLFLQKALGGKTLVSVVINGSANVQYDPQAASAVKMDFAMTNLVVKDPTGQIPATPLEAKMQVDTSVNKQVVDLRQVQLALTPTARATNQVQLTGQVDMSQTNAITGNLKLVADSLDFSTYYDLFMGSKKAPPTSTAPTRNETARTQAPPPATAPADANKEPDAMKLPFRNFTAETSIRRLYLHEMEIADWQTTTKIDGGHVVVNPFKLTLNGAPVNSTVDLDLGVPGWKYDVSLNAVTIPLAPLVNSFQPERRGILSGTMSAQAKLGGTGTTGVSLQKNLTGQFDMSSTNLNLSVDNIQGNTFYTRLLKTLVKAIVVIPDLAKNPASTATSLLQGVTGSGSSTSSSGTTELAKSPINAIILRGSAGSGRVDLQQATVQSPAFEAQASGTITLAEVLTNSPIQIPVSISLERSVAQRINMAGNTPSDATYAKLPDFLTMKGTLGNSKADINKIALTTAVLQGMGGKSGKAGGALQGLSSLLSGGTNASANAATNQSGGKAGGLLQGIGGILGNTTSPATNAPATNQAPVDNLIKGLFGPKKK